MGWVLRRFYISKDTSALKGDLHKRAQDYILYSKECVRFNLRNSIFRLPIPIKSKKIVVAGHLVSSSAPCRFIIFDLD